MPFFSVIIPVYNRPEKVKSAIDSVLRQTFNDYELIVVNDGSTDCTPKVLDNYSSSIISLHRENGGVSAARNTGIVKTASPYIAFLDSDDTWLPQKLAAHRDYIARHPSVSIHQTEDIWIRKGQRVNPGKKHLKPEGDIFLKSLELCAISPSAVMMKRDLFDTYGMFDERLPACEDYELWLRITSHEYTGLIKEQLITRYQGHGDQLSAAFWGMDRFRLYAICKLLDNSPLPLKQSQIAAARESALKKCGILMTGAKKRGNREFGDYLHKIKRSLTEKAYNSIDYQNLADI